MSNSKIDTKFLSNILIFSPKSMNSQSKFTVKKKFFTFKKNCGRLIYCFP